MPYKISCEESFPDISIKRFIQAIIKYKLIYGIYKEFVVVFKDIRALKILDDFSSFNQLDNEIRRNFKESKTYFGTEWIQDKSGTENQHLGIYIAHKDYFNP